ncbi:MAG: glycosyltransferase [Bacteroidetes bacterium]|nr:glycosyltransferase [Bacteroidota bacterium]
MKVAWVHSFNRKANENAGIFMFQLMEHIKNRDIEVEEFYTGKIGILSFWKIVNNLKKVTNGYDIIHAQYGSGCGLVSSLLAGKKLLTLRGSDWYISKKSSNIVKFIHTRLSVLMTKLSLNRFHAIITMSKRMTDELINSGLKIPVYTIMDGIDLIKFSPRNKETERRNYNDDGKNYWILFSSVVNNNPLKRFELAKQAFELVKKKIPNIELKFMSGIPHDKCPSFIACCDVVLLTSTHEGWPNIIKESLALNKPFVSTNVSDLKDIARNESSCTIVEEASEEIMVNEMSKGIQNAIEHLKVNKLNLRKYVDQMNIEVISDQIIETYKTLLSK